MKKMSPIVLTLIAVFVVMIGGILLRGRKPAETPAALADGVPTRKAAPCPQGVSEYVCNFANASATCAGARDSSATEIVVTCAVENLGPKAVNGLHLECGQIGQDEKSVAPDVPRVVREVVPPNRRQTLAPFTFRRLDARAVKIRCMVDSLEFAAQ
jgi:hypothetical protein